MSMRRLMIFMLFLLLNCHYIHSQAYKGINIAGAEYNNHNSYTGINVNNISPMSDGSYLVNLYNTNYNDPYDGVSYYTSYSFTWYLSYNGERVSDYYNSTIRCRKTEERKVYAWPNKVPKGYEKYVTVQFGREPLKKDRRDDD